MLQVTLTSPQVTYIHVISKLEHVEKTEPNTRLLHACCVNITSMQHACNSSKSMLVT